MRLTPADHALIHALHLLGDRPFDAVPEDEPMVLSILRDVVGRASRGEPALAGMIDAAERVLRSRGGIDGLRADLRRACHDWNRRRLAAAWDHLDQRGAA